MNAVATRLLRVIHGEESFPADDALATLAEKLAELAKLRDEKQEALDAAQKNINALAVEIKGLDIAGRTLAAVMKAELERRESATAKLSASILTE